MPVIAFLISWASQHLRALLAARDDDVADTALRCLTLLTMPPLLHRHQQVRNWAAVGVRGYFGSLGFVGV